MIYCSESVGDFVLSVNIVSVIIIKFNFAETFQMEYLNRLFVCKSGLLSGQTETVQSSWSKGLLIEPVKFPLFIRTQED